MKTNPVGWFEIYVQDMARARAFYEAVFQTELTQLQNPDPAGFPGMELWSFPSSMERYGSAGALVKMPGLASGGATLIYFICEDCAVEAARAAEAGGSVFRDKVAIGEYGFIALVNDTEGKMIGLHSMA